MKPIFQYIDYRSFLKDYFEFRRKKIKDYSHRQMVLEFGFSSPGYLSLVMRKERNLGRSGVKKIATTLGFSEHEEAYLVNLVKYCDSGDEQKKEKFYQELLSHKPKDFSVVLDDDSYFFENRMCSVILMLLNMYGSKFRLEPYWIANRIQVDTTVQEINKAMVYLVSANFLVKTEHGYKNNAPSVRSSDEKRSEKIQVAHKIFLQEAQRALDLPLDEREFGHLTFSLDTKSFGELKKIVKKFQEDVRYWVQEERQKKSSKKTDSSEVKQNPQRSEEKIAVSLNIQLYPITK